MPTDTSNRQYYRIIIRDSKEFTAFRIQDVGRPGGIQRVAGVREDGTWDTQAWLIDKDRALIQGKELVPLDEHVEDVFKQLGSKPERLRGNIFRAKPRRQPPQS